MFPEYAPSTVSNERADKALVSDAPVEIKTDLSIEDAQAMLDLMGNEMELSLADLLAGDV